jgi:RNA polymerase sigma-70 factor (ECF subfamily)
VEGDRESFRALYLAYHKRLSRFLLRFLRRRELIEEVINDTMYAVWCKAADFRGDSQLSTWIFGIAYRKALKAVRKDSRDPTVDPALGVDAPVPLHDPEASRRELRQCLDRALASLPAPQRIVIELAYFVGHSCEEIAVITTTPVNTIKTRLFHARERLRELLPDVREEDFR